MKKINARFYKTENGNEPVREWLKSLTIEEKKKIGEDIKSAEFGWPIGMPTCKHLGKGLHEIRTSVSDKWARIFFCVADNFMILLHAIMKKSNSTPKQDLELARKRMNEFNKK